MWTAVDAGNDISVYGYSSTTVDLSAGNDIANLWSRGNLVAYVQADNVVAHVETYAETVLFIDARAVDWIQSWGVIQGVINAADYVDEVRTVLYVTAAFNTPSFSGPHENFKILLLDGYPQTPEYEFESLRASIRSFAQSLSDLRDDLDANAAGLGEAIRAAAA